MQYLYDGKMRAEFDVVLFQTSLLNVAVWDARELQSVVNPYRKTSTHKSEADRAADTKFGFSVLRAALQQYR